MSQGRLAFRLLLTPWTWPSRPCSRCEVRKRSPQCVCYRPGSLSGEGTEKAALAKSAKVHKGHWQADGQ